MCSPVRSSREWHLTKRPIHDWKQYRVRLPSLCQIELLATNVGNSQAGRRVRDPKGKAHDLDTRVTARYTTTIGFPANLLIAVFSLLYFLRNEHKGKKIACVWEGIQAVVTRNSEIVNYAPKSAN
jgi:hypothetical protein